MKQKLTKIISAGLMFLVIFALTGCGLRDKTPAPLQETLEIWGVWDDSDVFYDFINQYKDSHKHISSITYRKLTYEEYEPELIRAFANGTGPDIFLAHHTWLNKYPDFIMSLEESQNMYNDAVDKMSGCSKPPKIEEPLLTERQYQDAFVKVVYDDFVKGGRIYGVPLAVDTMALYYNEDLFSEAGLVLPPYNWEEFEQYSRKLTKIDEFNNITQAGAALGSAYNVNRAGDIWAMLTMQYGSPIAEYDGNRYGPSITSLVRNAKTNELFNPGLKAMEYYTSFAKGSDLNYTWNPRMHQSIDIFEEGKAAMMLNYTYAIETVKAKAPKLNFKVAPIPQYSGAADANSKSTYANYWGYVVSRETGNKANKPIEAWKFLKFLGEKERVAAYVEKTKRPASRKDVLNNQIKEPNIGVFAEQALIAQSWPRPDEREVDQIINDNIEQVVLGGLSASQAVSAINTKFNVLLKKIAE